MKDINTELLKQLIKEIKTQNKCLKRVEKKLLKLQEDTLSLLSPRIIDYKQEESTNPCDSCLWTKEMKSRKEPYIGDVPCTFCPNNPWKITCSNYDVTMRGKGE